MGSPLYVHYITFIRLLSSYSFPTPNEFLTPTQQCWRAKRQLFTWHMLNPPNHLSYWCSDIMISLQSRCQQLLWRVRRLQLMVKPINAKPKLWWTGAYFNGINSILKILEIFSRKCVYECDMLLRRRYCVWCWPILSEDDDSTMEIKSNCEWHHNKLLNKDNKIHYSLFHKNGTCLHISLIRRAFHYLGAVRMKLMSHQWAIQSDFQECVIIVTMLGWGSRLCSLWSVVSCCYGHYLYLTREPDVKQWSHLSR